MFFWVIVTCHAEWSECSYDPQPTAEICASQADQINFNTDAIAVCTVRGDLVVSAPDDWAVQATEGAAP